MHHSILGPVYNHLMTDYLYPLTFFGLIVLGRRGVMRQGLPHIASFSSSHTRLLIDILSEDKIQFNILLLKDTIIDQICKILWQSNARFHVNLILSTLCCLE